MSLSVEKQPVNFETYFQDREVRSEFELQFVSTFDGWLGSRRLNRLENVGDDEWLKFNHLLQLIDQRYALHVVDLKSQTCRPLRHVDEILNNHKQSQQKETSEFTRLIIPELDAVYTEDWDYTWILWHRNLKAVEYLESLINEAGLFHWFDPTGKNEFNF